MHSLSFPPLITSSVTSRHILKFRRTSLYQCVCVYELQAGWEQEVTHRGIPRAVGFNLWARMFRECESSWKRNVKTIRLDRLLDLHSLGGTVMALRFTISFVIRTSCSTWTSVVLVFFVPLCTDLDWPSHLNIDGYLRERLLRIHPFGLLFTLMNFHSATFSIVQSNYWATNAGEWKHNYYMLFPPMHPEELYTENFNRHFQMFPVVKDQ